MGKIELGIRDSEVVRKEYKGNEELLSFKKSVQEDREDAEYLCLRELLLGIINFFSTISLLVFTENIYLNLLSIVSICLLIISIKSLVKHTGNFLRIDRLGKYIKYSNTDSKVYTIDESRGGYNDIVKIDNGKVYRVYQLIEDKNILNLNIEDDRLFNTELPISLGDKKIESIIRHESDVEGLSVKDKAVYNIGNTIPKISNEGMHSIFGAIEEVYKHKINVNNQEEYEIEYNKLLQENKDTNVEIPLLTSSEEYLENELINVKKKLNKELKENKELVEGIRGGKYDKGNRRGFVKSNRGCDISSSKL